MVEPQQKLPWLSEVHLWARGSDDPLRPFGLDYRETKRLAGENEVKADFHCECGTRYGLRGEDDTCLIVFDDELLPYADVNWEKKRWEYMVTVIDSSMNG